MRMEFLFSYFAIVALKSQILLWRAHLCTEIDIGDGIAVSVDILSVVHKFNTYAL